MHVHVHECRRTESLSSHDIVNFETGQYDLSGNTHDCLYLAIMTMALQITEHLDQPGLNYSVKIVSNHSLYDPTLRVICS